MRLETATSRTVWWLPHSGGRARSTTFSSRAGLSHPATPDPHTTAHASPTGGPPPPSQSSGPTPRVSRARPHQQRSNQTTAPPSLQLPHQLVSFPMSPTHEPVIQHRMVPLPRPSSRFLAQHVLVAHPENAPGSLPGVLRPLDSFFAHSPMRFGSFLHSKRVDGSLHRVEHTPSRASSRSTLSLSSSGHFPPTTQRGVSPTNHLATPPVRPETPHYSPPRCINSTLEFLRSSCPPPDPHSSLSTSFVRELFAVSHAHHQGLDIPGLFAHPRIHHCPFDRGRPLTHPVLSGYPLTPSSRFTPHV